MTGATTIKGEFAMATNGTTLTRLAISIAAATFLVSFPTLAAARTTHHDSSRDTGSLASRAPAAASAPEIDPSALGGMAALVAGGLAILTSRRRRGA
jgi:hypothetical protein